MPRNPIVNLLKRARISSRGEALLCTTSVMVLCLVTAVVLEGQSRAHQQQKQDILNFLRSL